MKMAEGILFAFVQQKKPFLRKWNVHYNLAADLAAVFFVWDQVTKWPGHNPVIFGKKQKILR
ncbi:hypothetical protein RJP21_15035 [Paenibacillus sp. VCA1]|uniref:hypothetical protein n=1 Tax=Paenibacillus sp. VCA1 TaxID=3039148 RepID=UPI002870D826|nr:hypothetical protein [Paenibacillus sp. VCA1]MDR9854927.1 hypothetical protein [Paenibacillus sp. VCA1]